jgi:chemotaxis protein CheD
MSSLVVGVGDCRVSNDPQTTLVTYALGSCIGLMIHDPLAGVGGLLHFMLPESSIDQAKAQQKPYMFADTGIPLLFRSAYALGADKRRLVVRAVGGAQIMDEHGVFSIGKRNYLALRKILWKAGIMMNSDDMGGMTSRTVRLEVGSGKMWLREGGVERELNGAACPGGRSL